MNINIDKFDLLHWLQGCAIGSHLRQGIWQRAVDEFYDKLSPEERLTVYMYAKRDLTEIFMPKRYGNGEPIQHVGHEDFFHFLACYNPNNRYDIHLHGMVNGKEVDENVNAYFWDDEYHVKFNRICAKEFIVAETPIEEGIERCNFTDCMWAKNCARLDYRSDNRIGLYANSKCDWFINKYTQHGADLKHFEI